MGKILCATRGGEESYCTQDQAISMAKEQDDALVFLYVVNTHFLDHTAAPIMVDVEDELHDMGNFLLLMAQERAKEQGVKAETMCLKNGVRETIKRAAIEIGASLIILGRPCGEDSAFKLADLMAFAVSIENETGIEVKVV
jgi:nucleotide-binding universal stress UspA family protein